MRLVTMANATLWRWDPTSFWTWERTITRESGNGDEKDAAIKFLGFESPGDYYDDSTSFKDMLTDSQMAAVKRGDIDSWDKIVRQLYVPLFARYMATHAVIDEGFERFLQLGD